MNITIEYVRSLHTDDGATEISFLLRNGADQQAVKSLIAGQSYRAKIDVIKSKRTLEQNAIMWHLIHEIAQERGTERSNDDWDIYIEALIRAGVKSDYVVIRQDIDPSDILSGFRAYKKMNDFVVTNSDGSKVNSSTYRVFIGSSKMDTKEMSLLLETVMDMATECGIEIDDWTEK